MSIIFDGKKCTKCGREDWYYSFGYPIWYQKMIVNLKSSPQWKRYKEIQKSKLCPWCFVGIQEPIQAGAAIERYLQYGDINKKIIKKRIIKRRNKKRW